MNVPHLGPPRWVPLLIAVGLGLAACAVAVVALGTRAPVTADSELLAGVVIRCDAGAGLGIEACRDSVDAIIAVGPPTRTFEITDVARVELHRSWFGFGSECEVQWYLERYADSPVATEAVRCPAP